MSKSSQKSGSRKARLIREEVKEQHTSHWDLDMLSKEQLETLMKKKPAPKKDSPGDKNRKN